MVVELLTTDALDQYEAKEEAIGSRPSAPSAPGDAVDDRPALASTYEMDYLARHQPAGDGPEGPARRVAA